MRTKFDIYVFITFSPDDCDEAETIQNSVKDLLNELRHVQVPLSFESGVNILSLENKMI